MSFNRNKQKAKARRQNVLLDCRLEMVTVSDDNPIRVPRSLKPNFWYWIAWKPRLHRPVIDGIGRAQKFSARVSRVLMCADLFQVDPTAGFVVTMQDVSYGAGVSNGLLVSAREIRNAGFRLTEE